MATACKPLYYIIKFLSSYGISASLIDILYIIIFGFLRIYYSNKRFLFVFGK